MELTEKKSEIIKNWLTRSDTEEIAGMLGYRSDYVRKVLNGRRSYDSPGGELIIKLALRKARSNKYMRSQKVA